MLKTRYRAGKKRGRRRNQRKRLLMKRKKKTYTRRIGDVMASSNGGNRRWKPEICHLRTRGTADEYLGAGIASQQFSTNQSYLLTKCKANGSETHYEVPCLLAARKKEVGTGQKKGCGDGAVLCHQRV